MPRSFNGYRQRPELGPICAFFLLSQEGASGLTAVWARENTRGDIFDSMRRKGVYATTGTRIRVRVFAGWDFQPEDIKTADFAARGYRNGVPMGGDLMNAPAGKAPKFLVRALRDPDGSTVDVDKATFTNTIGDALLTPQWEDPDLDPAEPAFYYIRVLEIQTPRWTTYDAAFFGIKRPGNVPATVQDRAYTSPIWYTPTG